MKLAALLFWLNVLHLAPPLARGFVPQDADRDTDPLSRTAGGGREEVRVNVQQSMNTIGPRFVGVTIDAWHAQVNWNGFPFTSRRVVSLARALAPNILRLGGTAADNLTYDLSADAPPYHGYSNIFTAEPWRAINQFVRDVGWDFIMDLNSLKRNADGSWDPANARHLLQFSADNNYTIAGFELGNEYDINVATYGVPVSPSQLAQDVSSLQSLLNEFPLYHTSYIIGPEVANTKPHYFQGFLAAGGAKVVYAAGFHHYYFPDTDSDPNRFTSIETMDSFLQGSLTPMVTQARDVDPRLPVWLSETSSSWVGGVPNVGDRFLAGFLWLDKLGLCAQHGVQAVLRQDLYGETYALMDYDGTPRPDYWLTVLFKRIVRGPVFVATASREVRVYSACAHPDNFPAGSLVVYLLNPKNVSVTFDLPQFASQPSLIYSLTGWGGDRLSPFMALNGVKLQLLQDDLPEMKPTHAPPGDVTAPPYSFTFLVFHQAQVAICMEQ